MQSLGDKQPDFDINTKKAELFELKEGWSKNKLKQLNKSDLAIVNKAFKILSDPNSTEKLNEDEYKVVEATLLKQPESAGRRVTNIFRKIHLPWSLESKTHRHMEKAEKVHLKTLEEQFYGRATPEGRKIIDNYFKENKVDSHTKAELIELALPLLEDAGVQNKIDLFDLLYNQVRTADPPLVVEYMKIRQPGDDYGWQTINYARDNFGLNLERENFAPKLNVQDIMNQYHKLAKDSMSEKEKANLLIKISKK